MSHFHTSVYSWVFFFVCLFVVIILLVFIGRINRLNVKGRQQVAMNNDRRRAGDGQFVHTEMFSHGGLAGDKNAKKVGSAIKLHTLQIFSHI